MLYESLKHNVDGKNVFFQMGIIASERDELLRAEYVRFVAQFPSEMFLFLDESSKDDRTPQV